ncbi:MAG: general secretion pathway protein GspE [Myxococcaceae bacterium]|nr:general secretion pathway protein GspE [Myxococcaceae bacterium]MCA3014070.1 general secretion pathway protein GspE [Myxococcaceae bacterium]
MPSIRLGDLLVKANVVSESQLKTALGEQQKWGGRLGEILVRMNLVTEDMLVRALSKQLNVPSVNLEAVREVPAKVRARVPVDIARDLNALPLQLRDDDQTLVVAMTDPQQPRHLELLRTVSRCRVVPQLAGRQALARAFTRIYDDRADLGEDVEGSFKLVDAQGHTIVKNAAELERRRSTGPAAPDARAPPPASAEGAVGAALPPGRAPGELLKALEAAQQREVSALKAMVELLIAKGVFTREEYLAKVRR